MAYSDIYSRDGVGTNSIQPLPNLGVPTNQGTIPPLPGMGGPSLGVSPLGTSSGQMLIYQMPSHSGLYLLEGWQQQKEMWREEQNYGGMYDGENRVQNNSLYLGTAPLVQGTHYGTGTDFDTVEEAQEARDMLNEYAQDLTTNRLMEGLDATQSEIDSLMNTEHLFASPFSDNLGEYWNTGTVISGGVSRRRTFSEAVIGEYNNGGFSKSFEKEFVRRMTDQIKQDRFYGDWGGTTLWGEGRRNWMEAKGHAEDMLSELGEAMKRRKVILNDLRVTQREMFRVSKEALGQLAGLDIDATDPAFANYDGLNNNYAVSNFLGHLTDAINPFRNLNSLMNAAGMVQGGIVGPLAEAVMAGESPRGGIGSEGDWWYQDPGGYLPDNALDWLKAGVKAYMLYQSYRPKKGGGGDGSGSDDPIDGGPTPPPPPPEPPLPPTRPPGFDPDFPGIPELPPGWTVGELDPNVGGEGETTMVSSIEYDPNSTLFGDSGYPGGDPGGYNDETGALIIPGDEEGGEYPVSLVSNEGSQASASEQAMLDNMNADGVRTSDATGEVGWQSTAEGEAFHRMDMDGDRRVSKAEFFKAMRSTKNPSMDRYI